MDNLDDLQNLQEQLQQIQHRMELDMQAGLGWSAEDVHEAGELMARITKIRAVSEGAE